MRDFVPKGEDQFETDSGDFTDFSPHPTEEEMKASKAKKEAEAQAQAEEEEEPSKSEAEVEADTPPTEDKDEDGYPCPDCDFVSKSSGGLKTHQRAKHE